MVKTLTLAALIRAWSLAPRITEEASEAPETLQDAMLRHETPALALCAVQALLFDPEDASVARRGAYQAVVKELEGVWPGVGASREDGFRHKLMPIKAVVLSSWSHEQLVSISECLAPFAAQVEFSEVEAELREIEIWYGDGKAIQSTSPALKVHQISAQSLKSTPLLAQEVTLPAAAHPGHNYNSLTQLIKATQNMNASNGGNLKNVIKAVNATLSKAQQQFIDAESNEPDRYSKILWWSQTRYSPALRKPLRTLGTSMERLWWAAWDLAKLCVRVPLAPSASLLVETLHMLGVDVSEEKPVGTWAQETTEFLRSLRGSDRKPDDLEGSLQAALDADPYGLPVLRLRQRCVERGDTWDEVEPKFVETGLNLARSMSLAQWAEVILCELVLEQRWSAWGQKRA